MKRYLFTVVVLSIFFAFLTPTSAEKSPTRTCINDDVVGAWTMATQTVTVEANPQDPFYFQNQRYVFQDDKTMKHMTSLQPITAKERALQNTAAAQRTYDVASDGTMIIKKKDSADIEMMRCTYILEGNPKATAKEPQQGDLLLTFEVNPDQPPALTRLLRREKIN